MFLIPGVVGPDEEKNAYKDLGEFVAATHEFRSESTERLDKLLAEESKRTDKLTAELKKDLMDYMRLQETEINNLRTKVTQIDEEIEDMMNGKHNDDFEETHEEEHEEEHEDEEEELEVAEDEEDEAA